MRAKANCSASRSADASAAQAASPSRRPCNAWHELATSPPSDHPTVVQRSADRSGLSVGAADDAHERAAERVADAVMSSGAPQVRERMSVGEVQRGGVAAPAIVSEVLSAPGSPLDAGVRAFMEARMGHDFRAVRVHSGARAAESANALGAHAYTAGQSMVFGASMYQTGSAAGRRLIAHELAHVVQQRDKRPVIRRFPNPAAPPGPYVPGRPPHDHPPQSNWDVVQQHARSACWRAPKFDQGSSALIPGPGRGAIECVCAVSSPLDVLGYAYRFEMYGKPLAREHLQHYVHGGGATKFEHKNLDDLLTRDARVRRLIAAEIEFQGDDGNVFIQQYTYEIEDFMYAFGGIDRVDYQVDRSAGTIDVWFMDRYDFHPAGFNHADLGVGDEPAPGRPTNCVHAAAVEAKASGAADYWMIGHATLPLAMFTEQEEKVEPSGRR